MNQRINHVNSHIALSPIHLTSQQGLHEACQQRGKMEEWECVFRQLLSHFTHTSWCWRPRAQVVREHFDSFPTCYQPDQGQHWYEDFLWNQQGKMLKLVRFPHLPIWRQELWCCGLSSCWSSRAAATPLLPLQLPADAHPDKWQVLLKHLGPCLPCRRPRGSFFSLPSLTWPAPADAGIWGENP